MLFRSIVDPGIGFGKTLEHNLALMARLAEFRVIAGGVLLGASRKSWLEALSGAAPTTAALQRTCRSSPRTSPKSLLRHCARHRLRAVATTARSWATSAPPGFPPNASARLTPSRPHRRSKERLDSEIEQMRQKHEEDMHLSDRITREIGSLREMAEQAELRGEKAEAELREKKPELATVLDSYEVVKKAYDQVLEEKFSLEQEIKKLEYSTAQDQGREETAKAETKDTVRRVKEHSTEIRSE